MSSEMIHKIIALCLKKYENSIKYSGGEISFYATLGLFPRNVTSLSIQSFINPVAQGRRPLSRYIA